ncbi:AraC family transcriptional regulator [Conexibacter sp. JD483]|uniref:AraC family transcriptional regulator n=1 Tax=unclassified Conexibacter TaxID=2627773 RepID=UPI00271B0A65|nr:MULTISPECIES: AraC family transcriptional regulator [unclassified Conexibacter]MDO8189152.1 AraC family transcriptional regulator [Conexibacter sp. CPCC 205706]MDO8200751.1 AraC family transcriptional regulator [Conexibacter sp. CPCC 205762]MDR9369475.1 AraC family transcriptional regulator [Conexibacter sp. JD483]
MDLLADMLALSGVRGTLGARIEAGEDWGWWAAESPGAAFHAVTSGTAWLVLPGRAPLRLMPGDVVLLPSGTAHVLGSDLAAVARTSEQVFDRWEWAGTGAVRIGSGAVQTHILCAHYEHDPAVSTQIVTLLPELIHVRAQNGGDRLEDTVRLLGRELANPQLASAVVLDRLVDILLVQLLRVWLANRPDDGRASWLGVLDDPLVGAAVARLHDDPARPWTTAALADEIAVSRATLSRRFAAAVGETPGAYLTRWRMDLAARRLRDSDDSLDAIAQAVGYTSVYAFSRAFSRARAQPPGRFRLAARASVSPPSPQAAR